MPVQVMVQHRAADYEAWKSVFDEHEKVRRAHGATGHRLYQTVDDPNSIVIITQFATQDGAQGFLTDPSLREAMSKAGVQGTPTITVCQEQEDVSY